MTLAGRTAKSFRIQRRWVVVRAGPNMVEREMLSNLASLIPQSGTDERCRPTEAANGQTR